MRRTVLRTLAAVVGGLTALTTIGGNVAGAARSDLVIGWNLTMLSTFAAANVPAPLANRDGAIVQAAVFDAVNGIDRRYSPIHVPPAAPRGASREAATISAAYTALVSMFPAQKSTLDAARQASLASLVEADDSRAIARGLSWGAAVADHILAWRAADGFASTPAPYVFGTAPGDWQPTPGGSGPPKFRSLATTTPFALTSPAQYRPLGPPALGSARYAQDFNEVKAYGGQQSSLRTAYQTETAKFWQLDTPVAIWDRVADSLLGKRHQRLVENARVLALVNIAIGDATIAVWDAKNAFNGQGAQVPNAPGTWRPVTAITQAARMGNPDVTPDPSWLPLLTTPYFQEYPSAHSGVSSAGATVLASIFGDQTQFTATSNGLPGVVRTFSSFRDAVAQVADARVYAGFHFRFSCNDAMEMGQKVGKYVENAVMLRA